MKLLTGILIVLMLAVASACISDDNEMPTPTSVASPEPTIPMATQALPPTPMPSPTPNSTQQTTAKTKPTAEPLSTPTPDPTLVQETTPRVVSRRSIPAGVDAASASVGARIYDSDVVVRATLLSAESSSLRFRVVEYLKGTGPSEITVNANPSLRESSHDNREALLFLSLGGSGTSGASGASGASGGSFVFTDSHYTGSGYSIDTLDPAWLPKEATAGGASGASDSGTDPVFITDSGVATGGSQETITLSDLKAKIAWVEGGEGIEGYDHCIGRALNYEKFHRDYEAYNGRPWTPYEDNVTLESGTDAGAVVGHFGTGRGQEYGRFWLTGEDAVHFSASNVDDNEIAADGYYQRIATARPLPWGIYRFRSHWIGYEFIPCDFTPVEGLGRMDSVVTVTAPAGTLHEAFFDPVTIGTAVGADATNGVLEPTSFTVGGTATQFTSLKWENNQAVLTLSPHASLANHALDFIELDGSVSLTLEAKDATVDSTAGTHTWSVTTQPWHDGDKLMLRMREIPKPPAFASDTYNFTVAEGASAFTIIGTVLATDPNEGDEVLHTIESGNEGNKFQIDGWAGFILVQGTLDYETTSTYTLTVKADDRKGGTDTATVTITITDVPE